MKNLKAKKKNSNSMHHRGLWRPALLLCLFVCFLGACGSTKTQSQQEILPLSDLTLSDTAADEKDKEGTSANALSALAEKITATEAPAVEAAEEGAQTSEPTPEPEPTPEVITITISAAGDCALGNYVEQDYTNSFNQMYESVTPSYFFENVYEIFSQDDLTLVNLECVLTDSDAANPGRTYNIKGAPEYVEILTAGSVEAVSMGNNHRLDFYESGTADTVAVLQEADIVYAYDAIVGIYETKGIKIGILSVNEASQGAAVETYIKQDIAALQEADCDLIIACCHWGTEGTGEIEAYQQELGRKCIDWGVDLVLGCHPHVLQGIEEYQGKYIVYSMGNFCFGANRNPSDKDTMIVQQTFTFIDGVKQEETTFQIIPASLSSVSSRNDYCPTPAIGEAAARILEKINSLSVNFGFSLDAEGYPVK